MSVREVTYYQVACDHPDCDVTTGSLGGDFSAWSEPGHALDEWINSDCQSLDDGRTFCDQHRVPMCERCDEPLPSDSADRDVCPRCEAEDNGSGDHDASA